MALFGPARNEITCPQCDIAEAWPAAGMFDDRGHLPEGRGEIRKCRSCGVGLEVRPRAILPGYSVRLIPADTWRKIEMLWERDHAVRADEPPPSAEEMEHRVRELTRLGHPRRVLIQLVMESLSCSRDEAEALLLKS